jgi:hypothetical protein
LFSHFFFLPLASRSRKALQKASAGLRLRIKTWAVWWPAIERPVNRRDEAIETCKLRDLDENAKSGYFDAEPLDSTPSTTTEAHKYPSMDTPSADRFSTEFVTW